MIDTIVLRFHDVKFHRPLIQLLNHLAKSKSYQIDMLSKGYDFKDGRVPRVDTLETLQAYVSKNKEQNESHLFLRFANQKIVSNSYNYNMNFNVNMQRDFIELSFSIPKFLYGTNVFMAIEHYDTKKNITYSDRVSLEYYAVRVREKIIEVLYPFLTRKLGLFDTHIDLKKIEVNRIDFCFNQIFYSKKDALNFLKYQKQTRKLYSRDSSDSYRNYETSLFYKTRDYSFKIYHKGTEFLKHDYKELKKVNSDKGFKIFEIDQIQELADKTLRYEVTFRNAAMSRIFKHNIFRSKSKTHNKFLVIHKNVQKIKDYNERIAERIGKYEKADKQVFSENLRKKYKIIPKDSLKIYDYIEECFNGNTKFMLDIDPDLNVYNKEFAAEIPKVAFFNNILTAHMFMKFRDLINEFQLKEQPDRLKISKLLDDFNKENKSNLNKASMLKFYDLWAINTERELIDKGLFSKATVYRFLAKFKKLGITNKCILPSFTFGADVSHKRYDSAVNSVRKYVKMQ